MDLLKPAGTLYLISHGIALHFSYMINQTVVMMNTDLPRTTQMIEQDSDITSRSVLSLQQNWVTEKIFFNYIHNIRVTFSDKLLVWTLVQQKTPGVPPT